MARSGTSANSCYGIGVSDPALHNQPNANGENQCYDPTNASKGYHSYPYKPVAYVYDANQLAEVKAGTRSPLNLQPVAEFDLPTQLGTTELTSAVYDDTTRMLYAVGARTPPRVHVMRIKPVTTTPPPVPCEGTWAESYTLTPAVCDATQVQTRTVTRTFTQTSGDVASCPVSPVVTTTTEACVYVPPDPTGEIVIKSVRPKSCDIRVTSTPPDNSGGWGVQFTLNGSNMGSRDTSDPYQRDKSNVVTGTIAAGVWSKSTDVRPFTIGQVVCE
jgi:hypothetical protein